MKSRILIAVVAVLAGVCFVVASSAAQGNPDDVYWESLGSGMDDLVFALTVYDGRLIAGGRFTTAGEVNTSHIASWDGIHWSPLGSGMNGTVNALTVYDGKLIAGGWFTMAGGVPATYVASWDGSSWSALGSLMGEGVFSLTAYQGELIAGSYFSIARWDGSTWSPLLPGQRISGCTTALAVFDGKLIAGGVYGFSIESHGIAGVAAWNGTSWLPLGAGTNDDVWGMTVYKERLIVGGVFTRAGNVAANSIASWDGYSWLALGEGMNQYGSVPALSVYDGRLVAGGSFTSAGGVEAARIASWDGAKWMPLGSGMNQMIEDFVVHEGKLFAGGHFTYAGSKGSNYVAQWTRHLNIWHVAVDGSDETGTGSEQYPYATIQRAINSAVSEDTVIVHPGTYTGPGNRDIDFGGKDIVLMSEAGPEVTIIDCEQQGRGFNFHSGETRAAKVQGFTITGGLVGADVWDPGPGGAGILCAGASPTIEGNRIVGNRAKALGGGIYCDNAQPLITQNVISGNLSSRMVSDPGGFGYTGNGGGIWLDRSDATIISSTIVKNFASSGEGVSGGILCEQSSPEITRCIIAFNGFKNIQASGGSTPELKQTDIYFSCWDDPGLVGQLGVNGNFSRDPMFCDTAAGDYHLSGYSPCAAENNYWDGTLIGALGVSCHELVCGDANMDGQLTSADVELLQDYYFFQTPPDIYVPVGAADMDCNDRISLNDLLILAEYFYGYGPAPCCVPLPPPPPKHLDGGVLD